MYRNLRIGDIIALKQRQLSRVGINLDRRQDQRRPFQRRIAGPYLQPLIEAAAARGAPQTRHEPALDYLKQSQLSIADIALLVGYREQGSFNHAFKERTGANLGAYRSNRSKQSA